MEKSFGMAGAFALMLLAGCAAQRRELPPEPAPPPPAQPQASSVRLSADALFAFGRADIADAGHGDGTLGQLAERLRDAQRIESVQVIGYTDRIGSDSYNQELSRQRAEAVRAFLVERGVPSSVIQAEGRGKADPVADCPGLRGSALVECLAPNRRVEINIVAVE